ncbi:MAG: TlpA disulfide reductase family protein [Eubacteriales bacterium]|nr:TlpA disulfide reductase family protein [Eubacteriales bacterium]
MKKVICLLLVLVLLFALCGCSKKAPAPTPAAAPAVEAAPVPAAESAPAATPEPAPAAGSEASAPAPAGAFDPDFTFSVTGRDGTVYTEQVFAEHALTVINSWTVWSEPSIAEMATLAKLWENYRDSGLMILSVYPMSATDADIENLQAKTGAGYPFVPYAPAFMDYQSGMFPNSILIDRAGHVVTHMPDPDVLSDLRYHFDRDWADFLGERVYTESMSYEDWEAIVLPYLTK